MESESVILRQTERAAARYGFTLDLVRAHIDESGKWLEMMAQPEETQSVKAGDTKDE